MVSNKHAKMRLMKKILIICIILLAIAGGFYWIKETSIFKQNNISDDYKNISYEIDGQKITLKNGTAENEIIPLSSSKKITKYFGNEVRADFNGDGLTDVAFLVTQNNGGSGTFFYIVAALNTPKGYIGTNAILLGDRIAPQTTEFRNEEIIVNYADRKPNEPMTSIPSVGTSKYFKVSNGKLDEKIVEILE